MGAELHAEPDPAPEGPAALRRLAAWLRTHGGPAFREVAADQLLLQRLPGGQSNPTYLLRTAQRLFVLRSKPRGPLLPSAHAIEREFHVAHALSEAGTVPVARPHALCEDDTVLGSAFYVMDHVPGRVLADPTMPGCTPAERRAHYAELLRVIAALHRVDPAAIGLADFGRTGNYLERQITRWTRQYRACENERIEAFEQLIAWLPDHMPPDRGEAHIVHGDYRMENVIFDPVRPTIAAVVDWELATLGDPLADFAYHMMAWRLMPGLLRGLRGADLAALGIPSEEEQLEAYCRLGGRAALPWRDWEAYLIFNLFRVAAIAHGIGARARQGTASHPTAMQMGALARPVAELAWQQVEAMLRAPAAQR